MARSVVPSSSLAVLCAVVVISSFSSPARAQIIYEPTRYQYGDQQKYYYGGSDPLVHDFARMPVDGCGRWGRVHGWAFASGNVETHREVATERTRVFTDSYPFKYSDASIHGLTPDDARNEAYCNAPRYYTKRDLLASAYRAADGTVVVPADAPTVRVDPRSGATYVAPRAAATTSPRPIMIIPKDLLKKRLQQQQPQSDKSFAAAR